MKTKRFLILILTGVVIIIGISGYYFLATPKLQTAKFHAKKISAAIRAYNEEMKANNLNLPASIPLQELIAKGFLKHKDVSAWDGWNTTVLLTTNEISPQTALMNAQDKDGNQVTLIADGSMKFKN
jgi:uncharacterized protein (UPF0333 family)